MAEYESLVQAHTHFEGFPELDVAAVEEAVNKHFEPYIFYRNHPDGRTLYTSCCGLEREWSYSQRLETPADTSIAWGEHNFEAVCPFCGRAVKLKQLGRCGQMKNLREWHPFFVYTEREGVLYAQGFWVRKIYYPNNAVSLTARPEFLTVYSYRHEPGRCIYKEYWHDRWVTYDFTPGHAARGTATFGKFYDRGKIIPFRAIGADAIERTFLRYCQYEKWSHRGLEHGMHTELPKYLMWGSVYPRQVEMLVKTGLDYLVTDLICGYERKRIINWQEENLLKAFDLSREEMNFLLKSKHSPYFLEHYKRVRRSGDKTTIQEVAEIYDNISEMQKFVTMAKRFKVSVHKLKAYLERFTGPRCFGGYFGLENAFSLWADYINMMEYLGRDLKVHNVAFPPELEIAHNEAAAEQAVRLELEAAEKEKKELAKYAESLNSRRKKYNFEYGEHFIRIAENQSEIVREGKTLQHCVGGYAGRHVQGSTTILFLRRNISPEAALYTIEMHGNQLIQIHGFKNDRGGPDPREVMKEMLDIWLEWLNKGSPRDKQGRPKIRKKKETNAA